MSRIVEEHRIDVMRVKCTTDAERIVAFLWYTADWRPTHELRSCETPFGWIGSAGDVRARELARNECADHLKGKIDRAKGSEIGLDPRYEYFRFKHDGPRTNAEPLRMFDEYPCQCKAPNICSLH